MSLYKASDAIEKPVEELFALVTRSGKFCHEINYSQDSITLSHHWTIHFLP
jgi:hypothetical protein